MDLAILRKGLTGGASAAAVVLLVSAAVPGQLTPNAKSQKMAVCTRPSRSPEAWHSPVPMTIACQSARVPMSQGAEQARPAARAAGCSMCRYHLKTRRQSRAGGRRPHLLDRCRGWALSRPRHIHGLRLERDTDGCGTPPGSQDTHIFAFPASVGTMIVKPDASGSFQFSGLQDPGSVTISGEVVWTCS